MENSKEVAGGKPNAAVPAAGGGDENPSPVQSLADTAVPAASAARPPSRTPFTSLSQEDADLALARTLQEQEHAYMMLRMGIPAGSDYGSSESGSFVFEEDQGYEYDDDANEEEYEEEVVEGEEEAVEGEEEAVEGEEDAFDVHALAEQEEEEEEEDDGDEVGDEIDPSTFESDEAYARALQEAEEREVAIQFSVLARISDWHSVAAEEERGGTSRNTWQEVDPDEFSYEELVALGDVVGTVNRGLSKEKIETLPSVTYKAQKLEDENTEQCVICRLEYDDGESLVVLPCKHLYHPDCINNWLQINKVCPMCSKEVSVQGNCGGDDDARQ